MIIPNSVLLLKSQVTDDGPDKYQVLLESYNLEVKQIKTLFFEFKNIENLRENLKNSSKYSGLILSSPRCVEAINRAIKETNYLVDWQKLKNFVVGETTFNCACKLNLNCIGKESGNAENLSKIILEKKAEYDNTKPFLVPHGNLKSDTINLNLQKNGIQIEEIEVYETVGNPNILYNFIEITNNFQSIPEYVVFFSPSGFSNSIELMKKIPVDLNQIKFIAIGPTTEMIIKEHDFSVYGVAKKPTPEEVLNVILLER